MEQHFQSQKQCICCGNNATHTHTHTNYVFAMDARICKRNVFAHLSHNIIFQLHSTSYAHLLWWLLLILLLYIGPKNRVQWKYAAFAIFFCTPFMASWKYGNPWSASWAKLICIVCVYAAAETIRSTMMWICLAAPAAHQNQNRRQRTVIESNTSTTCGSANAQTFQLMNYIFVQFCMKFVCNAWRSGNLVSFSFTVDVRSVNFGQLHMIYGRCWLHHSGLVWWRFSHSHFFLLFLFTITIAMFSSVALRESCLCSTQSTLMTVGHRIGRWILQIGLPCTAGGQTKCE